MPRVVEKTSKKKLPSQQSTYSKPKKGDANVYRSVRNRNHSVSNRARRRPRQERAKFTSAAILKAAAQVIDEVGWANASTNRIAKRAGVSIGSLYQYFDSKETILRTLIEHHIAAVNEIISTSVGRFISNPKESVNDGIRGLFQALIGLHRADPVLTRVLTSEVPRDRARKAFKGESEQYVNLLKHILEQRPGIRVRRTTAAAHILVTATEALSEWMAHDAPAFLDTDELIEEITIMLSGYVTGRYPNEKSK